jgi:hypothetical protein
MNEDEFRVRLTHIRVECEKMLNEGLTRNQDIALGAELQAHAQVIIERYRFDGYRRRD